MTPPAASPWPVRALVIALTTASAVAQATPALETSPAAATLAALLQQADALAAADVRGSLAAAESALAAAGRTATPRGEAEALLRIGRMRALQADFAAAREALDRCLGAALGLDDRDLEGRAHLAIARLQLLRGDCGMARRHVEHARLVLGVAITDAQRGEAALLEGSALVLAGQTPTGVERLHEALRLAQRLDLPLMHADALLQLTALSTQQSDLAGAAANLRQAAQLIERHRLAILARPLHWVRAQLLRIGGEFEPARAELTGALAEAQAEGDRLGMAQALLGLGVLDRGDSDPAVSLRSFRECLAIAEQLQAVRLICCASHGCAEALLRLGGPAEALAVLDQAGPHLAATGSPRLSIYLNSVRARAHAALGAFEPAFRAQFEAADTERWLVPLEMTGNVLRQRLEAEFADERTLRDREAAGLRQQQSHERQLRALWTGVAVAFAAAAAVSWWLFTSRRRALAQAKVLRGLLPICAACKAIRTDSGQWQPLESYIAERSEAGFTHGVCPTCVDRLYPDLPPASGDAR